MINPKHHTADTAAVYAALIVGTVGAAVLLMLPALLSSLSTGYQFDKTQLAVFSFADLGGLTLGSALGAHVLPQVGIRRGVQWGFAVAALANLLSAAEISFALLSGFRVLAGVGSGMGVAAAYLVIGRSKKVDRNFSLFLLCQGTVGAIALKTLPALTSTVNAGGIFLSLAMAYAASLLLAIALPASGVRPDSPSLSHRSGIAAWAGLVGIFAFFVAQGGVWAYLELIGVRGGVEPERVSDGVALSVLIGLSGPFIAAVMGAKLGRAIPLCMGLAVTLIALSLLDSDLNAVRFTLGVCLFNMAWNFTIPYQLSTLSVVDPAGYAVSWAASTSLAGLAVGAPFAAGIYGINGFSGVLWSSGALCVLSVALLVPVLLKSFHMPRQ